MTTRRPERFPLGDRRGIALPLVLMLTLFLTISIGAGFIIAGNEHQVGTDHDAQLKAFAVAQEGVERYLTDVTALPAVFNNGTCVGSSCINVQTISVNGGSAVDTMRLIRAKGGTGVPAIYAITATGFATAANLRRSAMTPHGQRTIAQFVIWQDATLAADAAFTSLDSINVKNGVSGKVSGDDIADPVTSCAGGGASIPGLAVPNNSVNMNGNSTSFIDGNPDNTPVYIGTPGPTGTAKDSVTVDWAGILAGSIAPDFVLDRTGGKNNGTWPTTSQFANWPVVMVKGNVTNGDNINNGEGVLIVTGNADLSNIIWHGIVLIGGDVTLSGNKANVWGSLITGLNVQLGAAAGTTTVGNGKVLVQYNSCDISKALLKFGGWRRIQNSWADNWPSYTMP